MKKQQRGGTVVGFILGVIVGLGGALAVAVYVTKVPVPFLNKNGTRAPDQDAAEAKRNKDWDPNAPLYGKNPARPVTLAPEAAPAATPEAPTAAAPAPRAAPGNPEALPPSADPLGDLARAKAKAASAAGVDPFEYFVQAGAFRTQQDADAQRAKLAMLGWEARVSERETNGRVVFRVRIGPFSKRDDAESLKDKLDGAGVESALVRVQR
ncbi:MAG: SPOR domain-containing protein [Alicycliphilus sp.]|jgi:cell division protein FtsN|nr:SPOR domain-containing protein [Alicycliphilus sp.]MBP8778603.1 SPOR domain-containing protein [Alicycliphilus sp.]HRO54120.1 SPOR domain-containing protein [Alicycliphilus sp.]HRP19139.1 SPOR domain-containing protein [Alicycliphilus sp.]